MQRLFDTSRTTHSGANIITNLKGMLLVFQLLEWISHPGVQQFSVNLHKDKQV